METNGRKESAKALSRISWAIAAVALGVHAAFAGFPATESYLPAVGRVAGQGGAQFYTTIWATNLTGAPVSFTFEFLKEGQANTSPASFADTLAPGQTKMYENVVESKLGLTDALGAARVTSTGEILLAERIYDQAPGDDLGSTQGLFFAGVPKSFSISLGQSASIQGVNQGGSENFRYNFALVETGGGSPTVNVQLFDDKGTLLGQKAYAMGPREQLQPNVKDIVPTVSTINARITATVTGGTGSVLLAGAQVTNESQDSSGFEMSFRDQLLGSAGGTAGVTSLNGLTGAVTLAAGSNVTLGNSGNTITINAAGGSGGGGLTLPFTASVSSSGTLFDVENTYSGSGGDNGIRGKTTSGIGVIGASQSGTGVFGTTAATTSAGNPAGVVAESAGVASGLYASSATGFGVEAHAGDGSHAAVYGQNSGGGGAIGVFGLANNGAGVYGQSSLDSGWGVYGKNLGAGWGVYGMSASGEGVHGVSSSGNHAGVVGESAGGDGVHGGTTAAGTAGVSGRTTGSGFGVFGEADEANGGAAIGGNAPNGGKAAHFYGGDVYIDNNLHVTKAITAATKNFKIDHPLDPANEYLVHASIESSEMLNVYSGNAVLDGHGVATIALPDWVEAENGDFRYQLTAVGSSQPGLYVAQKLRDHRFVVAGGSPDGEISWQITGVRRDPWALANPLVVEEKKAANERGLYLHPEAYGLPPQKRIGWSEEPRNAGPSADAHPAGH